MTKIQVRFTLSLVSLFFTHRPVSMQILQGLECSHEKSENDGEGCEHYKYDCYCNGVRSQYYCSGQTLMLVNGHYIFVIGLRSLPNYYDSSIEPHVHHYYEPNFSVLPLGSVEYGMFDGNFSLIRKNGQELVIDVARYSAEHAPYYTLDREAALYLEMDEHGENYLISYKNTNYLKVMTYTYIDGIKTPAISELLNGNATHRIITFTSFPVEGYMFILWARNGTLLLEAMAMNADPSTRAIIFSNNVPVDKDNCYLRKADFRYRIDNVVEFYLWFIHLEKQIFQEFRIIRYIDGNQWERHAWSYTVQNDGVQISNIVALTPLYYGRKRKVFFLVRRDSSLYYGDVHQSTQTITLNSSFSYTLPPVYDHDADVILKGFVKVEPGWRQRADCQIEKGHCAHICIPSPELVNHTCRCDNYLKNGHFRRNSSTCALAPHNNDAPVAGGKKSKAAQMCSPHYCTKEETKKQFLLEVLIYVAIIIILILVIIIKSLIK